MKMEDMRIFAKVAEAGSFTAAARLLGTPKQTLSRRVKQLEQTLHVRLLERSTRRLRLTDAGAAYAERCTEIVRLVEEANDAVTRTRQTPRGLLRVAAEPVFAETFLTGLIVELAGRWPEVRVDVVLTRNRIDLVEEGFDVAFRLGRIEDPRLSATRLGPAQPRYCASPDYFARRGMPATPEGLWEHECILVIAGDAPARWPFRGPHGDILVPIRSRLRCNSFSMAHAAALAGLGIAVFPELMCAADLDEHRLVSVLDDWTARDGSVWVVHPRSRYLTASVRALVELARERFGERPAEHEAVTT
jgi:DNA-binding transcriptional LysR family regulator